jgi:Zn finger protein HypA/HybF involved in hydrogenase expression
MIITVKVEVPEGGDCPKCEWVFIYHQFTAEHICPECLQARKQAEKGEKR